LFNAITDALAALDKASDKNAETVRAKNILQNVQRQTENMYIEAESYATWQYGKKPARH